MQDNRASQSFVNSGEWQDEKSDKKPFAPSNPNRFHRLPNNVLHDKTLSVAARVLLARLYGRGKNWGLGRNDSCGMGERQFKAAIRELVKNGYIKRVIKKNGFATDAIVNTSKPDKNYQLVNDTITPALHWRSMFVWYVVHQFGGKRSWSIPEIAEASGYSRKTVERLVKKIVADRHLFSHKELYRTGRVRQTFTTEAIVISDKKTAKKHQKRATSDGQKGTTSNGQKGPSPLLNRTHIRDGEFPDANRSVKPTINQSRKKVLPDGPFPSEVDVIYESTDGCNIDSGCNNATYRKATTEPLSGDFAEAVFQGGKASPPPPEGRRPPSNPDKNCKQYSCYLHEQDVDDRMQSLYERLKKPTVDQFSEVSQMSPKSLSAALSRPGVNRALFKDERLGTIRALILLAMSNFDNAVDEAVFGIRELIGAFLSDGKVLNSWCPIVWIVLKKMNECFMAESSHE